jgi:hypothetical protein
MLKLLTLLSITTLLLACSGQMITASAPTPAQTIMPTKRPTEMLTTNGVTLKSIALQVRDAQRPPVGKPVLADRDIGFADVVLQLENHREEQTTVVIDSIQIHEADTDRIYMATQIPKTIHLGPLEYSAQDVHLTNKTGFPGQGGVQAKVTLTIAGQRSTVMSSIVTVDRL